MRNTTYKRAHFQTLTFIFFKKKDQENSEEGKMSEVEKNLKHLKKIDETVSL